MGFLLTPLSGYVQEAVGSPTGFRSAIRGKTSCCGGASERPEGFWAKDEEILPFALPYFGRGDVAVLARASRALEDAGVRAGIYHLNVNRNMYDP